MSSHPQSGPSRSSRGRAALAFLAVFIVGCVLDDLTGPDEIFSDLGIVGDTVMAVGATQVLTVAVTERTDRGPLRILWSSTDSAVVAVDDGMVTALREGEATINARLTGPDLSQPIERTLTLRTAFSAIGIEAVDSLTGVGETRDVTTFGLDPAGDPHTPVDPTYETSDSSVFVIDESGLLRSTGRGDATLTATLDSLSAETPVKVRQVAGSVGFPDPEFVFTSVGRDTTIVIEARDTQGAPIPGMTGVWTSSDTTVVKIVAPGILRALRAAAATLTVLVDTIQADIETRVSQSASGLSISAGDGQSATVATAVAVAPSVSILDGGATPIEGATVTFSVVSGDGSLTDSVVTTDAAGAASIGSWVLGEVAGENRLRASANGFAVEFTATGTAGPISAATSLVSTARDTVVQGAEVGLWLAARDAYGNSLESGGATVAFATSGGTSTGSIGATADIGNGAYTATFSASAPGTPTTVTATVDGAAVTTTLPQLVVIPAAVANSLSLDSGDGQTAAAGTAVSNPLRVLARDGASNPVANVVVTFSVLSGGGVLQDSVVSTDASGIARLGSWELGTTIGANSLNVQAGALSVQFSATSVPGPGAGAASLLDAPAGSVVAGDTLLFTVTARDQFGNPVGSGGQSVTFSASGGTSTGSFTPTTDSGDGTYSTKFSGATAGSATTVSATLDGQLVGETVDVQVTPGAASQLGGATGDGQSAPAGMAVASDPSLQVLDAFGNPVAGVTVTFTVVQGGGSVTGATPASGADGVAAVGSWTLGPALGTNVLRASAAGTALDFTATATAGAADPGTSLLTTSKDTVVVGEEITLTLTGRDAFDNPTTTGGSTVVFSISGGTSAGTIDPTVDEADGTYTATFTGTADGSPVEVSATLDGQPVSTAKPSIVVVPSAEATTLAVQAGDAQTGFAGVALTNPPSVIARDAASNPVANVVVTFALAGGGGVLTDSVVATGADGIATLGAWALGTIPGANSLTATAGALSAGFVATGTVGPAEASASLFSVPVDTLAAGDSTTLTVVARDQFGNALTSGGSTVAFSTGGGTSDGVFGSTSDAGDGSYTATFTATAAGSTTTIAATLDGDTVGTPHPLDVTAGEPTDLTIALGDAQIAAVGATLPVVPTVLLTDALGNAVSGETVGFAVVAGGGGITDPVASTGLDGQAAVGSWSLGTSPGTNTLRATAGPLSVDFDATALVGSASPDASIVTVPVTNLIAGDSTTLSLQTKDAFGNDVPSGGATVVFTTTGGTSDGVVGNTVDRGDGTYDATFIGQIAGTGTSVSATLDGVPVTTTLPSITVDAGLPDTLVAIAGDAQSTIVNTALSIAPTVRVEDLFGNAVAGELVTFTVDTGNGSVTGASVTSDADGEAEVEAWVLGTAAGENSLLAAAAGLSTRFLADGLPDIGSAGNSLVTVTDSTVVAAELVTVTLTARDQFGNLVGNGGQAVTFSQAGGVGVSVGTLGSVTDNGDGTYSATFLGVTVGTPTTITATLAGQLVGDSVVVRVLPGAPTQLGNEGGDAQIAVAGIAVSVAPTLQVMDAQGNPVAGETVTFSVEQGGGSVGGASPVSGADGFVTVGNWTLGTSLGANVLRASAAGTTFDFTATAIAGPADAATSTLSVPTDSLIAGDSLALLVTARDQYGNALSTGGNTVAFNAAGGTSLGSFRPTSDNGDGTYTATFTGTGAGTPTTLGATLDGNALTSPGPLTIVAGDPGVLTVALGDEQSVTVGLALPVAPTVLLTDTLGNPVADESVGFAVVAGGGGVTGPVVSTGADGRAAVGSWTLGTVPGLNTLRATVGSLIADFDATALVGSASPDESLVTLLASTLTAGDSTTVTLQAKDAFGNDLPAGGATVVFSLTGGSSDGLVRSTVDRGDGTYDATLVGQIAGTLASVAATLDGVPVTTPLPSITVEAGLADTLVAIAGDAQTAIVNTALGVDPRVRVEDAFGNVVAGELVTFTVDTGNGSVTGASVASDAAGEAEVGAWVLGTAAGENSLLAGAAALSTRFLADGLPDVGSTTGSLLDASNTTVLIAELVTVTLTVRDEFGNPVGNGGQAVTFSQEGGLGVSVGTISSVTDNGDGTYSATFLGVTIGTPTTITATLDGQLIGDTVQIEVTTP